MRMCRLCPCAAPRYPSRRAAGRDAPGGARVRAGRACRPVGREGPRGGGSGRARSAVQGTRAEGAARAAAPTALPHSAAPSRPGAARSRSWSRSRRRARGGARAARRRDPPRRRATPTHAMWLVCTNGKRDACCARDGVPVARALAALRPDEAWECSHLGGHRFAANVALLPEGLCFGRVARRGRPRLVAASRTTASRTRSCADG